MVYPVKLTQLFCTGVEASQKVFLVLLGILPGFIAQAQTMTVPLQSDRSNPYFWSTLSLMILLSSVVSVFIAWYLTRSRRKYRQPKSQPISSQEHRAVTKNAVRPEPVIGDSTATARPFSQHVNKDDQLSYSHIGNNVDLLEKAINNISDGIFIADNQYMIVYVNRAYLKLTGESQQQALNTPLRFGNHSPQFEAEVKTVLSTEKHWSGEIEALSRVGQGYIVNLRVDAMTNELGKITHYVGVFSDITEQKNTEQALVKLTNVDTLTQLPNRAYFHTYQEYLTRDQINHALLCFDLDKFKKINDAVGHSAGDQLLHQLVERLESLIRKDMIAFRLGGDEFAIIIEGKPDLHRVTHFAQSLLDNLALPYTINAQEFVVKASIGIALYPNDGDSPQAIFKHADAAMYFAKDAGGDRYQFFQSKINEQATKQLNIENLIRYGLQEDLFHVFYQPKVNVKTGKLCGMEALVRFEHPEQGPISPAEFIPMAEETGQILEIGERVLRIACADAAHWVRDGLLNGKVAVNISALQFKQPHFAKQVRDILNNTGLAPQHIECEITEGSLIEDPETALDVMLALRAQGVKLSLDDFGTGYSSLAYLKRFPINNLKIDKAFIDDIAINHTDKNMVQAIINIAHNLGLEVIAEGVETEAQLAVLSDFGCEMMQGYLCSKPLPSERFENLLKAENLSRNQTAEPQQIKQWQHKS